MTREFREEVIGVPEDLIWKLFATEFETPQNAMIYFFVAHTLARFPVNRNDVGEDLFWFHKDQLVGHELLGNLSWLIPLARDPRRMEPVNLTIHDDVREKATW